MIRVTLCILGLFTVNVAATFIRCGGTSAHRTLTFKNPDKLPETCVYTFKPTSSRVCKIKFEFNALSLAPPSYVPYPKCVTDELATDVISICGENPGQHIFLTYPPSRVITLNFRLLNRFNVSIPAPKWDIKMTQMDCDENNVALAPPLCLQYFNAPKGVIESFNYQYGVGPYIGNTSYAICIRKPNQQSAIRITSTIFEMAYGTDDHEGVDSDCLATVEDPDKSEDYLYIPGSEITTNGSVRADKFCGTSLMASLVTSKTPGPFVMYFNSDQLFDVAKPERGFSLYYEVV